MDPMGIISHPEVHGISTFQTILTTIWESIFEQFTFYLLQDDEDDEYYDDDDTDDEDEGNDDDDNDLS